MAEKVVSSVAVLPAPVKMGDDSWAQAINTSKALFSGGLAGAVSRTATSPLERLKVMRQVQASGNQYGSLFGAFVKMYKEEGIKSYWKGNGTNVARIAPQSAVQFCAFDFFKRLLLPNDEVSPLRTLAAGGLAGATASVACYPLDLVRSFLSVQTTNHQYRGIIHCMTSIVKSEGVLGLYRGMVPTLFGIAPYVALNFAVFDTLKRKYLPNRDHKYFDVINFSLGAVSGGVAATLTYPTDVIRRRVQLMGYQGTGLNMPKYDSTWHCITSTVKQEGVRGLYKGMVPCWLKVVPSMAIAFMIYERCRKTLKFDPPKGGVSKS